MPALINKFVQCMVWKYTRHPKKGGSSTGWVCCGFTLQRYKAGWGLPDLQSITFIIYYNAISPAWREIFRTRSMTRTEEWQKYMGEILPGKGDKANIYMKNLQYKFQGNTRKVQDCSEDVYLWRTMGAASFSSLLEETNETDTSGLSQLRNSFYM